MAVTMSALQGISQCLKKFIFFAWPCVTATNYYSYLLLGNGFPQNIIAHEVEIRQ
jgi:hypothetical protein